MTAIKKQLKQPSGFCRIGSNQAGFTIIELMIGIALGFIVSIMVVGVYLNSRKAKIDTDALSAMQENTRFAMNQLSKDIRMAGFFGGADRLAITNSDGVTAMTLTPVCHAIGMGFAPYENQNYNQVISVHPYASGTASLPPCLVGRDVVIGSDILFVRYAIPTELANVENDKTYIVSGIEQAMHYTGSEIITDSKLTEPKLTAPGGKIPDGKLFEYRYYVYFVSMRHSQERPSLRRLSLEGNIWFEEVIAEDIEDIHFVVGVAGSEGQIQRYYKNVADVPDWTKVVAVNFFVRSQIRRHDLKFQDKRTYTYGNRNFTPLTENISFVGSANDNISRSYSRYQRRLNETTVTIYNNQMSLRQ